MSMAEPLSANKPILIVTSSAAKNPERFAQLELGFELVQVGGLSDINLSPRELSRVRGIWVNFDSIIGTETTTLFPDLSFLATTSTGVDHIQLTIEAQRRIAVVSLEPKTGELDGVTSTVELTWALVLSQFAHVSDAHVSVLSGSWQRNQWERARQLSEQTLGVVGFGRIGKRVARVGSSFGMEILVAETDGGKSSEIAAEGFELVELSNLARRADWVTLHADAREDNRHLIDSKLLEAARPFHLVNTARASLVSEPDIVMAIRGGKIKSYSADVLQAETSEGRIDASPIVKEAASNPRILITPHIGGATVSAYDTAENIIASKILTQFGPTS